MACESCGDKPNKCNKDFTKAVIEIDNPEQITLMRKVTIPASMGDDTTVPPAVGKYHNVLLYYEANQKSYLYSSDGIPTQLVNGVTDYEAAVNLPQINGHTLLGNQSGDNLGLQNKLTAGANISIDSDNVISAVDTTYGPATDTEIGLVKPGDGLSVDINGTMSISDIEQYAHFFDTVADMKAATNLVAGDYARTAGFYNLNDNRGALYKIRELESGDVIDENVLIEISGTDLVAELVDNSEIINNLKQPTTTSFTVSQGKTLTGTHSAPINAGTENTVVSVTGNNATIDNVSITNTNSLSSKTAIKAYKSGGNTAGLTISNTVIGANFDKGIVLDSACFSSFSNIRIGNTSGASLTLENSTGGWTGVQDFTGCIFHSGNPTVLIDETDTNTISFNDCCFEDVTNNVIENKGTIYVNRSYFGDMVSTGKETHLLYGYAGSKTYFNDCTLAITPAYNTEGSFNTHFALHGGAECYVNGGLINAGNRDHASAIYSTDNSNDKIYIDGLKEGGANNWTPYYLYPYTPLRSQNPMRNYVINGTLTDTLQTKIGFEATDGTVRDFTINSSYVNPFGGNVVEHEANATYNPYMFYFEVPDEYVGKPMVLQIYGFCSRGTGDTHVPFAVNSYDMSANSDLSGDFGMEPFNQYASNTEFDSRNVFANQKIAYPKKKRGVITVQYQSTGIGFISISGIALLDDKNSLQMGTFVSADKRASTHIPTNTSDATKGDFVYNFNSSPTCEGWLFDGTSWDVVNQY